MQIRPVLSAAVAAVVAATTLTAMASPAQATTKAQTCSRQVTMRGYSDALDKTTYQGAFVGDLSSLATDRRGHLFALSDRSKVFTLDHQLRPRAVTSLTDENDRALDSEGLAVERNGDFLVTSELEPSVRRFDRHGRLLGRLPVPDTFQVAPAGHGILNRTLEGLSLDHGGRTLVGAMEGWLTTDGMNTRRFQTWERHGRHDFRLARQWAYTAEPGYGISEIAATGDGRYLVLERSFAANVGWTAKLYLADPRHATDTSRVKALAEDQPRVRFAKRTLLADLSGTCPSLGAVSHIPSQANPLIGNIEGMTIVSRERGGRLKLLLVTDDGESPAEITRLYDVTVRLPH
ncbi:esterase-like activity of phytase family protein [Streptomyces sp. NPDC048650]|uniref:esterase-like activity of phytase family protein n=1 Tax=Streptomyces sp. NPDC048650 TaxID=3365583 RepID=UPI00371BC823